MRIDFDVHGDVQVSRELLRMGDYVDDPRPAFDAIADDLVDIERAQFQTEGGYASAGWEPHADSTVLRKRASQNPKTRRNAERILHATEALRDSLTDRHDPRHVEQITRDELQFGTRVPYARHHQKGEGVPRRRFLELREQDRRGVVRTLQRWVMTGELG